MPSRRIERINELIRTELGDMIARLLRDPRLAEVVSITEVDTSPDLGQARVYISVLGGEAKRKSTLVALEAASGFLRRELAGRMSTRNVPRLNFRGDDSIERGERIMDLLRHANDPVPDGGSI